MAGEPRHARPDHNEQLGMSRTCQAWGHVGAATLDRGMDAVPRQLAVPGVFAGRAADRSGAARAGLVRRIRASHGPARKGETRRRDTGRGGAAGMASFGRRDSALMWLLRDELKISIQNLYGGHDPSGLSEMAQREFAFVTDPRRLGEADEVQEVAAAFVAAELHPQDDRGLGVRGGAVNRFPALGLLLGKKNPTPGSKESNDLAAGIMFALASGYAGGLAIESALPHSYTPGASQEHVWSVVVANFRADGARKLGLPSNIVDNLERFGQDAIADAMGVADIGGWGTRKAPLLGRCYAHAGVFLRVAQTDMDLPHEVEALAREGVDHWPYERYAATA